MALLSVKLKFIIILSLISSVVCKKSVHETYKFPKDDMVTVMGRYSPQEFTAASSAIAKLIFEKCWLRNSSRKTIQVPPDVFCTYSMLTCHLEIDMDDYYDAVNHNSANNKASSGEERYLFDFTKDDNLQDWVEQSDTVRTIGMSKATLVMIENKDYKRAIFFVLLNPQSDGFAFAGMRVIKTYDLTGYTALQIDCRGQGKYNGYKIVLRHKGLNDEPNYTFEQYFEAPKDEFAARTLPFSGFKTYHRGQPVNSSDTLDISQITSVEIQMYGGVFMSTHQYGPATLEISYIKAI